MNTNTMALQDTDGLAADLKAQLLAKFEQVAQEQGVDTVEHTRAQIDAQDKSAAKLKLLRVAAVLLLEYLLFKAVWHNDISLAKHRWAPVTAGCTLLALYIQYQAEADLTWKVGRKVTNLKHLLWSNRETVALLTLGALQSYYLLPYYTSTDKKWGRSYLLTTAIGIAGLNLYGCRHYVQALHSTKQIGYHRVAARMLDDYDNKQKSTAALAH